MNTDAKSGLRLPGHPRKRIFVPQLCIAKGLQDVSSSYERVKRVKGAQEANRARIKGSVSNRSKGDLVLRNFLQFW